MNIHEILKFAEGPERTAALVAWIQGLFGDEARCPVLVGGAAVELYTLGSYTTGDLDFVGSVTAAVARALQEAGFERHGRHWIYEAKKVFVEFPGRSLAEGEEARWKELAGSRIRIISPEDLLVDRLGAWEYWKSSVDGVNSLLLWQKYSESMEIERLERRVNQADWNRAWLSLQKFAATWGESEPSPAEIEQWANDGP